MAFTVVMMAGLLQILFGVLKLGRYIALMPFPVISGFMSGIGCIIIVLQLTPLVGRPVPVGGTLAVLAALPDLAAAVRVDALAVGALALAIVYLVPARMGRILPSVAGRFGWRHVGRVVPVARCSHTGRDPDRSTEAATADFQLGGARRARRHPDQGRHRHHRLALH